MEGGGGGKKRKETSHPIWAPAPVSGKVPPSPPPQANATEARVTSGCVWFGDLVKLSSLPTMLSRTCPVLGISASGNSTV